MTSTASKLEARPDRPVQPGVPPHRRQRDRLRRAARDYVRDHALVAPVPLAQLTSHAGALLAGLDLPGQCLPFAIVVLNNELWRDRVAAVPFQRRLFLMPQCLRDSGNCSAKIDPLGLVCARCGRCVIDALQARAEQLGYVVMVAEGSPLVTALIESGQVEAVVGVSCLAVLERVFGYMDAAAVPGIAIPLLQDGCTDTAVDTDWVFEELAGVVPEPAAPTCSLDRLRGRVDEWFTPAGLAAVLGPAANDTQSLAHTWLARGGKRWRPLLAACVARAMLDENAALPDDFARVAVAVECFHKASLIHDDIEDNDRFRYGAATLHTEHGVAIALNVGDYLLGEGYRLLAESEAPPERRAAMLAAAARGHRTLALGQGAELFWRRRHAILAADEVLDIFREKTASAFEVALRLGALYAGAADGVLDVLARYSGALGVAYQIADDLDDTGPGPDRAPDSDDGIRPSLLAALAAQRLDENQRERLARLASRSSPDDRQRRELHELYAGLDVHARARELLVRYKNDAIDALAELQSPELKTVLRRVLARIFTDIPPMGCCDDHQATDADHREPGPRQPR